MAAARVPRQTSRRRRVQRQWGIHHLHMRNEVNSTSAEVIGNHTVRNEGVELEPRLTACLTNQLPKARSVAELHMMDAHLPPLLWRHDAAPLCGRAAAAAGAAGSIGQRHTLRAGAYRTKSQSIHFRCLCSQRGLAGLSTRPAANHTASSGVDARSTMAKPSLAANKVGNQLHSTICSDKSVELLPPCMAVVAKHLNPLSLRAGSELREKETSHTVCSPLHKIVQVLQHRSRGQRVVTPHLICAAGITTRACQFQTHQ